MDSCLSVPGLYVTIVILVICLLVYSTGLLVLNSCTSLPSSLPSEADGSELGSEVPSTSSPVE